MRRGGAVPSLRRWSTSRALTGERGPKTGPLRCGSWVSVSQGACQPPRLHPGAPPRPPGASTERGLGPGGPRAALPGFEPRSGGPPVDSHPGVGAHDVGGRPRSGGRCARGGGEDIGWSGPGPRGRGGHADDAVDARVAASWWTSTPSRATEWWSYPRWRRRCCLCSAPGPGDQSADGMASSFAMT